MIWGVKRSLKEENYKGTREDDDDGRVKRAGRPYPITIQKQLLQGKPRSGGFETFNAKEQVVYKLLFRDVQNFLNSIFCFTFSRVRGDLTFLKLDMLVDLVINTAALNPHKQYLDFKFSFLTKYSDHHNLITQKPTIY